ncbi:MAG: hypothetical protein ACLGSD_18390 [Acidobacteriota bacterium]
MPEGFGPAVIFGLIFGFMWGIGCSLAIMYSIFLGGYRKAIKESLATPQPDRYVKAFAKVQAKRAKKAAASASLSS